MKKLKIIFGVCVFLVVAYGFAGFFGIPYFINNHLSPLVKSETQGGELSLKNFEFNPFTLEIRGENISFRTPKDEPLVSIEAFYGDIDILDIFLMQTITIDSFSITSPKIIITQGVDKQTNYQWLLDLPKEDSDSQNPSSFGIAINHFTLNKGSFVYHDRYQKDFQTGLDSFSLTLRDLVVNGVEQKQGSFGIKAIFNQGGSLSIDGILDRVDPAKGTITLDLKSGDLAYFQNYLTTPLPLRLEQGSFELSSVIDFDLSDPRMLEISKTECGLDRIKIHKSKGSIPFFGGDLVVENFCAKPFQNKLSIDAIRLIDGSLSLQKNKNGSIDAIELFTETLAILNPKKESVQASQPNPPKEEQKWDLAVGELTLHLKDFGWIDRSTKQPYRLLLKDYNLGLQGITLDDQKSITGSLHGGAITLYDIKNNTQFFTLEGMKGERFLLNREGKMITLGSFGITKPSVYFARYVDGNLSLNSYFEPLEATQSQSTSPKKEESTPWNYELNSVVLDNGKINFEDHLQSGIHTVDLTGITLVIDRFSSDFNKNFGVSFQSKLQKEGRIVLQGTSSIGKKYFKGGFMIDKIPLVMANPYLADTTYLDIKSGSIGAFGDLEYKNDRLKVDGKLAFDDWLLYDTKEDTPLFGWKKIGVTPFGYSYPKNILTIDQLTINGFYANTQIDQNKTLNFSKLLKSSESNTTQVTKKGEEQNESNSDQFGIDITKVVLQKSSASFEDRSLIIPFKTHIKELNGAIFGVSTIIDTKSFIDLKGDVDESGKATIGGFINTKNPKEMTDMMVRFDNLELKQYSPYAFEFVGYKIDNGKLFLELGYKIEHNILDGKNRAIIKNIELGEEKEGGSPWPMNLVVALLENNDNVIDINLPVQGDINEPDFKYGKLVWNAIGNILTKAVTAPFSLLGNMLGLGGDGIESVEFLLAEGELSETEIAQLSDLVLMLKEKPKLKVSIESFYNIANEIPLLQKKKFLLFASQHLGVLQLQSTQELSHQTLEELMELKGLKKEQQSLKGLLAQEDKDQAEYLARYHIAMADRLIQEEKVTTDEVRELAKIRSMSIKKYLIKNGITEDRVIVLEPKEGKINDNKTISSHFGIVD